MLGGAHLKRAHLTGATLVGTNFTGAYLREASLGVAQADNETVWPEEFDPKFVGVIFKD